MENNWLDISLLNNGYKILINKYFEDIKGKYKIINDILYVDIDKWGIEQFYIKNQALCKNQYYDIKYNSIKSIYNIAILIQIGNWNVFLKMENYLLNFKDINHNIYFTIIDKQIKPENIIYLQNKYQNIVILICENKGMDIGLFLMALHYIQKQNYKHDYIIKIHTKTNDSFRNQSLYNLMGSSEIIINNIKKLNNNNNGMISGNTIYSYNHDKDPFIYNLYYLDQLIKYLYNENINFNKMEFSAGTFFIIKNDVFDILNITNIEYIYNMLNNNESLDYYWYSIFYNFNINNKNEIYNDYIISKKNKYANNINYSIRTNKPGLRDCMIEHSIERLFGYICKNKNLNIVI